MKRRASSDKYASIDAGALHAFALLYKEDKVCSTDPETIIGYLQASWKLGRQSAGLDLAKLYKEGMAGLEPDREKAKEILWELTLKPSHHADEADRLLQDMAREELNTPVVSHQHPPVP